MTLYAACNHTNIGLDVTDETLLHLRACPTANSPMRELARRLLAARRAATYPIMRRRDLGRLSTLSLR